MTQAPLLAWPGAPRVDPNAARDALDATIAPLLRAPALPLARAVVAGGGAQALGFAVALARTGVAVSVLEPDPHDAQRARDHLAKAHAPSGVIITEDSGAAIGADLVTVAGSDLCAGSEARLLALAPDTALVLRLNAGAVATPLGTPRGVQIETADALPGLTLVELLATPGADRRQLAQAEGVVRRLNAIPVRTATPIGAPLLARFEDCAELAVYHGATPWELDAALEGFGFALGPCAAQDQRGLDRAFARHRAEDAAGTRRFALPVLDRMVPEGRLGRQGSVGWYRYPGGGGRVIDPLIEDLAREEAWFHGVTPRPIADDTLRQALVLSLIDAAAILLSQGAPEPLIDLVAVSALGFPSARGGPLWLGRQIGFAGVAARLHDLAHDFGPDIAPSAALSTLA